jgi:O-antigen/teichoic acid export membrane protein
MISVIAFGLQPAAIRDLALATEWRNVFSKVQSARITLGLLLILFVVAAVFNKYYLIFLLAPIIAASGEYALYARGQAVYGAFISFLRLTIPFTSILITAYFLPSYTGIVYVVSLILIHFITIFLISWRLGVESFSRPSLKSLKLYVNSIPLGIVTLAQYMIGLGILLVAPYFYPSESLAIVFAGLKFYVLYKGVLRIIHQAFVQEMLKEEVCLKVDQLSMMIASLFVLSVFFFPGSFVGLFFGKLALLETTFFQLLGVSALTYSIFLSMGTSALLQKKDRVYSLVSALSAVTSIVCSIALSYFFATGIAIGVSLLAGELFSLCGLVWIASDRHRIARRLLFLAPIIVFFVIPFLARYFLGDHLLIYIVSVAVVGLILLLLHHKKFRL